MDKPQPKNPIKFNAAGVTTGRTQAEETNQSAIPKLPRAANSYLEELQNIPTPKSLK